MKKRVVLIHGWEGTPQNDWFSWVSKQLQEKGWNVEIPEMPNTKNPDIDEWMDKLASLSPDINTLLVGHSLSNALILKYLQKPEVKIKGAVMVAAWNWLMEDVKEFHTTFYETDFDYETLRRKNTSLIIVNSTNDPWIDFERSKKMAEKLNAEFISIENAGHFMEKDEYKEFPQLLKIIQKKFT